MNALKALFIAVMSLAVTASPVVASLKLCCCSKPAEHKKGCCPTKHVATSTAHPSCCAKKDASTGTGLHLPGSHLSSSCCCIKAVESASLSDRLVRPDVEKQSLHLAVSNEDQQRKLLSLQDIQDQSPGRFTLSGPPLLALYCTWLK